MKADYLAVFSLLSNKSIVSCAAACIAHTALASRETAKKVTHVKKCTWQQNSESLKEKRDRTHKP
jgi:hypothetical protein